MYYAICGRKGHGKDTLGKRIQKYNSSFKILHFADTLKQMSGDIWGLTNEQMNDPDLKEELLYFPCDMDNFIGPMSELTGLDIELHNLIAYTPRQILQYFGSDYVRSISPNYWIDVTIKKILEYENVIIADTRFPNEAEAIRNIGGKVILVNRIDILKPECEHISEAQIDSIVPDISYGFTTGDWDSVEKAAKDLATGANNGS